MNRSMFLVAGAAAVVIVAVVYWVAATGDVIQPMTSPTDFNADVRSEVVPLVTRDTLSEPNIDSDFFNRELPTSRQVAEMGAAPPLYPAQPPSRKMVISGESELELELGPGVREPTVLLPPDEELTPAQEAALNGAFEAFVTRLEAAFDAGASGEQMAKVWEEAMAEADSTYRNIFGSTAFNRQSMEAAVRALGYPAPGKDAGERGAPVR